MQWVKAKWISPLFAALDRQFPNRRHTLDGTIGDVAHMTGVSGHNPDDTPGVRAERQDTDSIPEVRAADADSVLNDVHGLSMWDVIQALLHGPRSELDRLIYIIYDRRIWRKSNGWREEVYDGDDPHVDHSHFSGDPNADEDARPWSAIENIHGQASEEEDDMGASTGPITIEYDKTTSLNIPPVNAGGADPRPTWLNLCNETFGVPYALRIWITKGNEVWTSLPGADANGLLKLRSGQRFSQILPDGTSCVSITRKAIDATGKVVDPSDDLKAYEGHLTCCFERGAVKR